LSNYLQKKELTKFYKKLSIPCGGPAPCEVEITLGDMTKHKISVDDFGFLDLSNHVSDKKHIMSGLTLTGKPSDFKLGKNKLQDLFDKEGNGTKIIKVKDNQSSWSPFFIEKKNGQPE